MSFKNICTFNDGGSITSIECGEWNIVAQQPKVTTIIFNTLFDRAKNITPIYPNHNAVSALVLYGKKIKRKLETIFITHSLKQQFKDLQDLKDVELKISPHDFWCLGIYEGTILCKIVQSPPNTFIIDKSKIKFIKYD